MNTMTKNKAKQGKFMKDPYEFLRYYAGLFFISVGAVVLLILFPSPFLSIDFSWWHLLLVPVGMYLALVSGYTLHNASHLNYRPFWMNRVVGEISGFYQLYGMLGYQTAHLIHHRFPDDPEMDPHPTFNITFWKFVFEMQKMMRNSLRSYYFKRFGETKTHKKVWAAKNFFAFWGIWVRALFWFLLLGPAAFLFLYLPSYLLMIFMHAHFNFMTHRPREDGTVDILNLNHNLLYKFFNFSMFGLYFHKNHHVKPWLFNPSTRNFERSR